MNIYKLIQFRPVFQCIRWEESNSKDPIIHKLNVFLKKTKKSVNETVRPGLQTDDLLKRSNSKEQIIHKSNN